MKVRLDNVGVSVSGEDKDLEVDVSFSWGAIFDAIWSVKEVLFDFFEVSQVRRPRRRKSSPTIH